MTYDNTDRGVLFKNDKKETPAHPDYTGNLNVGGKEFYLSAWVKESKKGNKFFSVSVKSKDDLVKKAKAVVENIDDDIPF